VKRRAIIRAQDYDQATAQSKRSAATVAEIKATIEGVFVFFFVMNNLAYQVEFL